MSGFAPRLTYCLFGLLLGLVCAGLAVAGEPLSGPADIEDVYKKALASGDAGIVAPYYAPDAKLYPPDGSVVDGRKAIRADLQRGYDESERSLEESHFQVIGDDRNAILIWNWRLRIVQRGHTIIETGRSLHVWRNGKDGWQIHQDMFQTF